MVPFFKNINTRVKPISETESFQIKTTQYIPLAPWSFELVYVEEHIKVIKMEGEEDQTETHGRLLVFEKAAPFSMVEQREKNAKYNRQGEKIKVDWEYKETPTPYTIIVSDPERIQEFIDRHLEFVPKGEN